MAVRFNSDASALKRTANLPAATSFTLAGWFKFETVTPARFWGAMGLMSAVDGVSGRTVASTTSGGAQLSLEYTNSGGTFVTNALLTVSPGVWYFIALTGKGNAIGDIAAYIRALGEQSFVSITNSAAGNSYTPGALEFGREGFTGEFGDGQAFGLCAFDTPLTSLDLMRLSFDLLKEKPFTIARPNFYWRMRGNNDLWDRSGNARHPTVTAGVDRPGVKTWTNRRRVLNAAAAGTIAGTASWTWGQSAALTGLGALAGTSAWAWSQSGALTGLAPISGTASWTWGQSGTLTGRGALSGSIPWTWGQSATLSGLGALAGTTPWTWSQAGTLTGLGNLAGTSAWTWSQSGDLTNGATGVISGTASWTWSQSASLTALGALAGSSAWTWNQSATLTALGALQGTATWTWGATGDLTAIAAGTVAGTAAWTWNATGDLVSSTPPDQTAIGGSKVIGLGLFYHFEQHRARRRKELDDLEERERLTREIADEVDRQIAEQFRLDEARAARQAEAARLQRLADMYARRADDLPPHIVDAITKAAERRTDAMLQRLQREILLAQEEQEAALVAALMLADD